MRFCNGAKSRILCLLLLGSFAVTALTSCATTEESFIGSAFTVGAEQDNGSSSSNKGNPSTGAHHSGSGQSKNEVEITSIEQINPTYEFIKWKGEQQLTIDEESFRQIIALALNDVRDFYIDVLGAPNINFVWDAENKKLVNTQGRENFYQPEVFNVNRYQGMSTIEASPHRMIAFVNDINLGKDNPAGLFQNMPLTTIKTLEEYFKNTFHMDIDFSNLNIIPSQSDIQNVNTSKEVNDRITRAVYNAAFLTIATDVKDAKSASKGHSEIYINYANLTPDEIMAKYNLPECMRDEAVQIYKEFKTYGGIYSPTLLACLLNYGHLHGFVISRTELTNGNLGKVLGSDYVQKTTTQEDILNSSMMQ